MSRIESRFTIDAGHACLPGHFPGKPIVPGVLVLDHVFLAIREATGRDVAHLRQAKFLAALLPSEVADVACEAEGGAVSFRVTTIRAGAAVLVAEGSATLRPLARSGAE